MHKAHMSVCFMHNISPLKLHTPTTRKALLQVWMFLWWHKPSHHPHFWWPRNVCTTHLLCVETMPCCCLPCAISSRFVSMAVSSSMLRKLSAYSHPPPPPLDLGWLLSQPSYDECFATKQTVKFSGQRWWHRYFSRGKSHHNSLVSLRPGEGWILAGSWRSQTFCLSNLVTGLLGLT